MDYNYQSMFKVESRKLLWLLAGSFFAVLLFQYIELPYGDVPSLLFSWSRFGGNDVVSGIRESSTSVAGDINNGTLPGGDDQRPIPSVDVEEKPEKSIDESVFVHNGSNSSNATLSKRDMEFNASSEADYKSESITVEQGIIRVEDEALDAAPSPSKSNDTFDSGSLSGKENISMPSEHGDSSINIAPSLIPASAPVGLLQNVTSSVIVDSNITSLVEPPVFRTPSVGKEPSLAAPEDKNSGATHGKEMPQISPSEPAVISISEMNRLLDESRSTYRPMRPRWSSAADQELVSAKLKILNAPVTVDSALYAPIYRNVSMFKKSYELMEEMLKVYIYKEGEKPILHVPVLKGIYSSEGWFMKQMKASKRFVTKDARKAHLFYLPFSSRMLEESLYVPNSHSHRNLIQFLQKYLDLIGGKYPFWNRTGGSDHFLVACHDWAPSETRRIMARCIRALCNSDVKEGFVFGKDVALPETYVRNPQKPLRELGGYPPSKRSILAFFAGNMHGYLRPILLQHWGNNRDPDMRIFGHLPKARGTMTYSQHMQSSKYCICAKGYEVNSPRVVESIFFECVPVIISDNFVPPFFDVLNWESFAVFVLEKDIPNLKNILLSIPEKRYDQMQMRVKKVQQHFLWHPRPVKYDIFHMILHSVWYNRVLHVNPR